MSRPMSPENWAMFAVVMAEIRAAFPEHAREIDRCVSEVGRKLESCGDPNCTCRLTHKNFNAISNPNAPND